MDPQVNPYQPGAGRRPPELAGRQEELDDFMTLMLRCERGAGDRGRILHGLRGVGKTVLLNEFAIKAGERDWMTTKVEAAAGRPLLERLTQQIYRMLRDATGRYELRRLRRLLSVFTAFSLKLDPSGTYTFGVDLEPARGVADSGDRTLDLTELMGELGRTAADLGVGVLVLIDEMQEAVVRDLEAVNVAAHESGQGPSPLPVVVVGAGLPSLPAVLTEASSYAERLYEYRVVGPLFADAAHDALAHPAEQLGVGWSPEALDAAVGESAGNPFFLQTYGKCIWNYAKRSPIDLDDASAGMRVARDEIDAGLYSARWRRASPGQRKLMRAMAEHGEAADVAASAVAETLGKKRADISLPRDELIKKGLVYSPERGFLAFTVPGMADFIRRQPSDD